MKKVFLLFLVSFLNFFSFSQVELNTINTSYISSLTGKPICEPQRTSYGFAILTDAKNIMGYTTEGKKIFSKNLYKARKPFFGVLKNDFLAVITNNGTHLSFLNPDGNELWNTTLDFKAERNPVSGRDGRFFISGKNIIECYGITGIKKWSLNTPDQSKFDIQELNDGSILIILEDLVDSKTKGLRISPFGEVLEEIIFNGEVKFVLSFQKGLLLTFSDSSAGLFSIENNNSVNKWVIKKENPPSINNDFFVLSENKNEVIYINHQSNSVEINYIDLLSGNVKKSFFINNIGIVNKSFFSDIGVFLFDSKNAYLYNNYGRFLWSGTIPTKSKKNSINYTFYTSDNNLILFYSNWSLHIFKTTEQKLKNNPVKSKLPKYEHFYKIDTSLFENINITKIHEDLFTEELKQKILLGNYNTQEIKYASTLLSASKSYFNIKNTSNFGTRIEKSPFETNQQSLIQMISHFPLYSCDTFTQQTAQFLKTEKNQTILHHLLKSVQENPYDPENYLLDSIEILLNSKIKIETSLYIDICDAIYSICLFNGYSSIEYKGRELLTSMLYPNYNSKVRDYSRSILKKL